MYDKVTGIGKIHYLGETGLLLDASLDLQKDARLPVIQLRDLIKLDNCSSKRFLIPRLKGFHQRACKLGFACCGKGGIEGAVTSQATPRCDGILTTELRTVRARCSSTIPAWRGSTGGPSASTP